MTDDGLTFCGLLGTAYCGSTMFSYILGSSNDIFSTGELVLGHERYRCANVWHGGDWTGGALSRAEKGMKHDDSYHANFGQKNLQILLEKEVLVRGINCLKIGRWRFWGRGLF